jgi:hypothetical protein
MGSIGRFRFILERWRRISIANNATSARPPRTQPMMIPTLDVELRAAADPEVPVILLVDKGPEVVILLLADEGPEVDEVVLSGSSTLG